MCILGCCDRLPFRGIARGSAAPAVRIRRRCDTNTNFDYNQGSLNIMARTCRSIHGQKDRRGPAGRWLIRRERRLLTISLPEVTA